MQKKLLIAAIILVPIIALSAVFFLLRTPSEPVAKYKMTLEVWGIFDDSEYFQRINQDYQKKNPQILEVKYKKIASNIADYEKELSDAIASGNGPDIFFFHNTWMTKHGNKITPLADSTKNLATFKSNFVDVAYNDFVRENNIYAMPLYCDTLALYYNKDILNQAGITAPPSTWDEVLAQTKLLTKIDSFGNITQSAIALGRSQDPGAINRASDILMLLMMQAGAEMAAPGANSVNFDAVSSAGKGAGLQALDFYTQFSQGNSESYTWNSKMDYSIDSFRFGKTAMMINYSYWKDRLKKTDPKLNFEIASVPQLDSNHKVSFADYWGLAVAKNKDLTPKMPNQAVNYTNEDRTKEAWKYITYVTMKDPNIQNTKGAFDPTKDYLEKSHKPAARRDLIDEQKNDINMAVFADQALTAKSWNQPDNTSVETIFVQMIDDVVSGRFSSVDAIRTAAMRINSLIKNDETPYKPSTPVAPKK